MATLQNTSEDTRVILTFKKTSEFPDWIGYELKVFLKKDSLFIEYLSLAYPEFLYFENIGESEILILCEKISQLAYEQIDTVFFTPIDEGDFQLRIIQSNLLYEVYLFFKETEIFNLNKWSAKSMLGLKMKVDKNSILKFKNEIKQEHEELFRPKLLTRTK